MLRNIPYNCLIMFYYFFPRGFEVVPGGFEVVCNNFEMVYSENEIICSGLRCL